MNRRGFATFELLFVLLLLLAIEMALFPVFWLARQKAQSTHCASSLRCLTLAARLYAEDYDSRPMPVGQVEDWADLLMPYLDRPDPLDCPTTPTRWTPQDRRHDYLLNDTRNDRLTPYIHGIAERAGERPPRSAILFGDGRGGLLFAGPPQRGQGKLPPGPAGGVRYECRHRGWCQFGYVDGSVGRWCPASP